jgi:multidrug efflux pump subunit AcrA (membrane-fusion protein)
MSTERHASLESVAIRTHSVRTIIGVLVLVALVLLVLGVVPRVREKRALAASAESARSALPNVYVIHAVPALAADLTLAGTTQAFQDAIVYARTSGYLSRRLVDIGDKVRAGQLLAEIASPEVEQQLRQGQADFRQSQKTLEQQRATRDFAHVTRGRYLAADAERAVAKEMVDQSSSALQTAEAAVAAARANVQSNSANVRRLRELTGFQRVVAPFAGTIIRRNVDVGALITAGSPNSTLAPGAVTDALNGLFEVAQLDTLRVFVNVPQVDAASVKLGMPVRISVRGHLEQPVLGAVTRTANAIDPATRTLLVEVDIPNASHALLPGLFVNVSFSIAPSGSHWRVPATALVADAQGTRIVTVAADDKLHFQPVVIGRDLGATIDVQAGLRGDERIVQQPSVSQREGQHVKALENPPP